MVSNRHNQTSISEENIAVAEEVFINDISNNIVILDAIVPANIRSNVYLPQYEHNYLIIRPLLAIKESIFKMFLLTLPINLFYIIINPLSIIHFPILILNVYCFKFYTKSVIRTMISCNLFLIFGILLCNIVVILNLSNLSKYLLKNDSVIFRAAIIYTLILSFSSIIIICQFLFSIYTYIRSLILYRSLTNEQQVLLLEMLQ